jgi:putative DNA primase/helicase
MITADLDHYRNVLADVLSKQESGGLDRKHLIGKLIRDDCTNAIKLEWVLMPKNEMVPGAPVSVLARVKQKLPQIQFSRRMVWIWEAVREFISDDEIQVSGRIYIENGEVKVRGVSRIRKRWKVPTVLLDATLPDLPILQAYYPQAEIVGDWTVEMPHVTVRQFVNAPVTQQRLMKTKTDGNRDAVRRHILQRWMETGRQPTLVICQEAYEKWLTGIGLPANIAVEHFNNVAGLDRYKHVRLLITIGRTLPGPEAVEAMAAALTGKEPVRVQGQEDGRRWYQPEVRGAGMCDGTGVGIQCDVHPDPVCEAIRFQICEAEIIQAIGRARGVNRTRETPLDIDILANVVLPVDLTEASIWREPSTLIEAFADGILLTNRNDMWRFWRRVWPNEKAAQRALEDLPEAMREQTGTSFYKESGIPPEGRSGHSSIKGITKDFVPIWYQLPGERMRPRHGFFDPAIVPEPRAWLEERLGQLAAFEVVADL